MTIEERNEIMRFYDSLNESQKNKVEEKLGRLLRLDTLNVEVDQEKVKMMRYQIASDMFRIING